MEIKKIIKTVALFLNEQEVIDIINHCEENEVEIETFISSLATEQNIPDFLNNESVEKLRLILNCINLSTENIGSNYIEVLKSELVSVENLSFDISSLTERVCKVKKIKNNLNFNVSFKVDDGYIKLPNGLYQITYSYLPDIFEFDDTTSYFDNKLSMINVCYLVCSNYCLIKGLFEEANMWEEKFLITYKNFKRHKGEIILKQRRWL